MCRIIPFATAALLLGGCAEYYYQPAVNATAMASGHPAAFYQIPSGHPTGTVRLATFGLKELEEEGGQHV